MTLSHSQVLSRRRFLIISAVSALVPASASMARNTDLVQNWTGRAMGAPAKMTLVGLSSAQAAPIFKDVEHELTRLERIFSLYQDSELVRLNRATRLDAPSHELLEVLSLCDSLHQASAGAFDPSIQPLWVAHAQQRDLAKAQALVGWRDVRFESRQVSLRRAGMALTLNGIAQGYITDKIAALLRGRGLQDVLLDMGEIVAMGYRADGGEWHVGVADPAGQIVKQLRMGNRGLATSAPQGTVLTGMSGHILNPDGTKPNQTLVSVSAPRAVVADGLSTALCVMPTDAGRDLVAQFEGARIEVLT